MKTLADIERILNRNKDYLLEKYGVGGIALFGSYTRNEQTELSDIDILVDLNKPIGLDFVSLGDELEEMLGVKVDLVTRNSLKDKMYKLIEQDIKYV